MATKPKFWLVKTVGILLGVCVVSAQVLGNRLNKDQLLGCLLTGALMTGFSFLSFLLGALPFRAQAASDLVIRWAFVIACLSLAYSVCQIPLWSYLTHQFPPGKMSDNQAVWVTAGVVISLFGPAAPFIVRFGRIIRARDKERKEAARSKKLERN